MDRNYKVYVHINKANGKRYFGITGESNINRRWRSGKGYKFWIDKKGKRHGNEHFWNAINKYGWNNFEHIVLAKGLTKAEAKWLEIELIREWDTTNREYGYNQSLGGEGGNASEETRKKLSEALRGENNYMYGKKGKNSPNYGKTLSEEHKQKISKANKGKHKGKNNYRAIKVYCKELDQYFDSIAEASEILGCCYRSIQKVLNGERKTAKGYHFIYANEVENLNIDNERVS